MKKLFILSVILFCCGPLFAQVTFQFMPDISGRSVDGLFNCRMTNPSNQRLNVSLSITVTERKGGTVCMIKTPAFSLYPGTTIIPANVARGSSVQFSSGKLGRMTSTSKLFPEGDYDYCYSLNFINSDNMPDEECFSYTLEPFADMNLIDPNNQDSICDKRPTLNWQPLIPAIDGTYYQVVLAEIKTGQNATEALNYNLPVINQPRIISPVLPYPPSAPELEKGKNYAWQVTAYKDQTILNRSEIWQFLVKCPDTTKTALLPSVFRDIEDLALGNFYIARGYIKFSLVNSYTSQPLRYTVYALKNPDKAIKGLPKIQLKNGTNNIVIDLKNNRRFMSGAYYVLEVTLPNGLKKSLRFQYEDLNEE